MQVGGAGRWIELAMVEADRADEEEDGPSALVSFVSVHRAPLEIALGARGWSILDALRFRPSVAGRPILELRPPPPDEASFVDVDGRTYPGCVRLVPRADLGPEAYDVVNHVAVERYLPGVLGRELFRHWHPETFAAQAIAARSFACAEHVHFGSRRHYDLTDTASSQEYIGRVNDDRALEATAGTRGIVLGYGGALVPGYYSSCCGGLAADARDAIGDHPSHDVPPLRGRSGADVCTDAPLYSWSMRRPVSDLLRRLRAYGKARKLETLANIASLRAIDVSSVNAHGRPRAYVIGAENGVEVELAAERLRRALDYTPRGRSAPDPPAWSSHLQITIAGGEAKLDGHGHGHGAGLCQHGAEALARAGQVYPAILDWYYPEIDLERAYA
ncbi:MAG: SpoIID/LytB domain-containing protein [Planctomycetota bacterium]|nr:SpoIID/LytB domain-containing protein [Planctomycetota bacterium]